MCVLDVRPHWGVLFVSSMCVLDVRPHCACSVCVLNVRPRCSSSLSVFCLCPQCNSISVLNRVSSERNVHEKMRFFVRKSQNFPKISHFFSKMNEAKNSKTMRNFAKMPNMYVLRPCTSSMYVLHLRPPCTSSMYVLHVRPPCTSSMYVLDVRPPCTSYIFVLHVRPPCTSSIYVLHVRPPCTSSISNRVHLPCESLLHFIFKNRWRKTWYVSFSIYVFNNICHGISS